MPEPFRTRPLEIAVMGAGLIGRRRIVSGHEGLAALEVIEAIKQSARSGKTVFPKRAAGSHP
ncbi:hypothetical protein ACK9YZ_11705 [Rhizobium sp. ZK1]|uniref:hypothetical protein n=1 Tax=Rhizobium sp. ZK1 TaxID=3389872 RepID=UPI0039F6595E